MVKTCLLAACWLVAGLAQAQSDQGPVLFGDAGGRLWKWQDGEKNFFTPEGLHLELTGVDGKFAWGWASNGETIRWFTMELPKEKKEATKKGGAADAAPVPKVEAQTYPKADRVAKVGTRVLLVYGPTSDRPRWELWTEGVRQSSKAYDDGRVIYGQALGPEEGWLIVGRHGDGTPWIERSGTTIEPPSGWRGRLTVAAWIAADEKSPAQPQAAGWAAPSGGSPRPLFWGIDGWTQPAAEDPLPSAGVYPILGAPGAKGVLTLAGWKADAGTGVLRPWFWDGETELVPGGAADGQPQVFSAGAKGGAFLVVSHQSSPWFTLEDGHKSLPLVGLGPEDHVRAVASEATSSGP